jgi:hypothetical protein
MMEKVFEGAKSAAAAVARTGESVSVPSKDGAHVGAKASQPQQGNASTEQLGAGWSRNRDGTLKYESDLLSQILVPGRVPADQTVTHLANGNYLGAAVSGAAWVLEDVVFVLTLGGSHIRTATANAATLGAEKVVAQKATAATSQATIPKPTGSVYSVAAEVRLSPSSYPGVSRGAHAQEANEQVLRSIEADPSLARTMNSMGVQIERTATGLAPRTSPANWTWHHAQEPGTLQLVPREQHAIGSIFQDVLHPGGTGGYSIWGRRK